MLSPRANTLVRTPESAQSGQGNRPLWLVVLMAATFLLFACQATSGLTSVTDNTSTPVQTPGAVTPRPEAGVIVDSPDRRQLVVWLPDFTGFDEEGAAAEVLTSAFLQFEQRHPGVRIDVQVKAESGQADIPSYLRSAQRVAPTILPDLVLIDSRQIWRLADLGLLSPMETTPMEYSTDFYPFAVDSVEYKGDAYGVPYAADVIHLAGFLDEEQPAPVTWNELLTQGEPYLFPAAGGAMYENGRAVAGGRLDKQ
jgi:maltose-binding protein MalE